MALVLETQGLLAKPDVWDTAMQAEAELGIFGFADPAWHPELITMACQDQNAKVDQAKAGALVSHIPKNPLMNNTPTHVIGCMLNIMLACVT